MDTSVHQITSIGMLIAALSVIAPNWKPSKHTSTVEWINKLQYIHTTERYGAMRTHMRQPHTAIMDGSQEHHSEWGKKDTKLCTLCNCIYVKAELISAVRNHELRGKKTLGTLGVGSSGDCKGAKGVFCKAGNILLFNVGSWFNRYKIHQTVHIHMHFSARTLFFIKKVKRQLLSTHARCAYAVWFPLKHEHVIGWWSWICSQLLSYQGQPQR